MVDSTIEHEALQRFQAIEDRLDTVEEHLGLGAEPEEEESTDQTESTY